MPLCAEMNLLRLPQIVIEKEIVMNVKVDL